MDAFNLQTFRRNGTDLGGTCNADSGGPVRFLRPVRLEPDRRRYAIVRTEHASRGTDFVFPVDA